MKFRTVLFVALLLAMASVRAADIERVQAFVTRYAAAKSAGDYKAMARMSYGGLLDRSGGLQGTEAALRAYVEDAGPSGRLPQEEHIERIAWFGGSVDAPEVYLVEVLSLYDSFPTPLPNRRLYVVRRDSVDASLQMLDLGCISVGWVTEIAPRFRGSAMAADLVNRNMINPQ
jgi:hypothetical protein